jgi:type IV pilus assembly protein PilY1
MNTFFKSKLFALSLYCGLAVLPLRSMADDIDIFLGSSGGAAAAPKVMIMLDNSTNDLFAAKLDAISSVLNSITAAAPVSVGLAMWSPGTSPKGAYIRFAPRDMSIAANRTALQNILALIKSKNESAGAKDEPEVFYEIYKYFAALAPYAGGPPPKNPNADKSGNTGSYTGATAFGQGLTSGFAFKADGTYDSTDTVCSRNFIIYIAANNGFTPQDVQGKQTYESLSAGPALPPSTMATYWGDEWTRYLYTRTAQILTYVIDAASPGNSDAGYTAILQAEAKQGGGSWRFASSQSDISTALSQIFGEIKAVNSTFASASLPVNTTNRAQNKNQVFIPMFRPDPAAKPLWMGNLKQYQMIVSGTDIVLGDGATPPIPAVNPTTGFPTDCATSFWTTDSGSYWSNVPETPSPAGQCPSTSFNSFSDAPDGPFVEKGGAAEVIRKGNNPATTNTTPTWAVNRTIYTQSGTALTAFNATSTGLTATGLVPFILGQDVNDENTNCPAGAAATHTCYTEVRPSLHGDSVHSRPLPIDYGGTTGVTVYYGSNDGTLRAVDSTNGQERWAFIAPEFNSRLQRLKDNSPKIIYPNQAAGITPTPIAKDYFFDGSLGIYQNADNSKVWIYPSMRRGGRMIYALDVTNPATPVYKWKIGCPNLADDINCTAGMAAIGQTWSKPSVVSSILGYTGAVVIMGGGYDGCEDANTATPTCTTPKGAGVHVVDAFTGAVVKSFSTTRSVVADIALIAITTPGVVDHAYAVDTGGNIYRIDFAAQTSNWTINRVAYTNGSGRKFFYAPALLPATGGKVYLAIGSGDREHPLQSQYPYAGVVNRLYVYKDDLASTLANDLDSTATMSDFTAPSTCATAGVLPASSMKGWFMNLNQNGQGEQTVTSAIIGAGMVAFSTNRPIPAAAGTCSTTLGEARGYWVNLFNGSGAIGVTPSCGGTRSSVFPGGGLPPSPVLGNVPINGVPTTVVIGAAQRSGAGSAAISPQQLKPAITSKRKRVYRYTSTDY